MTKILLALAMTCSVFAAQTSSAATLTGDKALALISTFHLMNVFSTKPATPGYIDYNLDLSCARSVDLSGDSNDSAYAIPTYTCDVGVARFFGARAIPFYDVAAQSFGTETTNGRTTTHTARLECRIDLAKTDLDQRFTCTYN